MLDVRRYSKAGHLLCLLEVSSLLQIRSLPLMFNFFKLFRIG